MLAAGYSQTTKGLSVAVQAGTGTVVNRGILRGELNLGAAAANAQAPSKRAATRYLCRASLGAESAAQPQRVDERKCDVFAANIRGAEAARAS